MKNDFWKMVDEWYKEPEIIELRKAYQEKYGKDRLFMLWDDVTKEQYIINMKKELQGIFEKSQHQQLSEEFAELALFENEFENDVIP